MKHYERPVAEMIELRIDEEIMGDLTTSGGIGTGGGKIDWTDPSLQQP